MTFVLILFGY